VNTPAADPDGSGYGWYPWFIAPGQSATQKNGVAAATLLNSSLGKRNSPNDYLTGWDFLPFHDRDFQSVAELMLVPGIPPGLFAKQFVEVAPDPSVTPLFPASTAIVATNYAGASVTASANPPSIRPATLASPGITYNTSNTYAYAGQPFPIGAATAGTNPTPGAYPGHTYPYLVDKFFYNAFNDGTTGSTADGWFQMLEYFEVPPPTLGAIGEVASGANYDWYRQDVRPGQLNLNLIIDEEVFFGLVDDPRLLRTPIAPVTTSTPTNPIYPGTPQIVTQIDANFQPSYDYNSWQSGTYVPTGSYFLNPVRGYWDTDLGNSVTNGTANYPYPLPYCMKAAFADFLRQRHGGSNFLFAWGTGGNANNGGTVVWPPKAGSSPPYTFPNGWPSSSGQTNTGSPAPEKPFRSLSNGDITTTVLRPAVLSPTKPFKLGSSTWTGSGVSPGLRDTSLPGSTNLNLNLNPNNNTGNPIIPDTPPRRLFELPDRWQWTNTGTATGSNAAERPRGQQYNATANFTGPTAPTNIQVTNVNAASPMTFTDFSLWDSGPGPFRGNDARLGAKSKKVGTAMLYDNRQHPAFRHETLQKIMNLTTVRTHQYAVWLTVGFFEVVQPGNSQMSYVNPMLIVDQLGQEIGASAGKNVRFRSFFVLDRTKATGFNPANPGNFRDLVMYRSRIE
jgi:hypothetical protein